MTRYEQSNKIDERFIITYSRYKMRYLKDNGFYYLFTGNNTNTNGQFWVFDATPEIKDALDGYEPRPEFDNDR